MKYKDNSYGIHIAWIKGIKYRDIIFWELNVVIK